MLAAAIDDPCKRIGLLDNPVYARAVRGRTDHDGEQGLMQGEKARKARKARNARER